MKRANAPVLVALYLAPLVVVQAWALFAQVQAGYRPFGAPPDRVAFSWDMFAVKVERCTVAFDPPLVIGGRAYPSYASMRPPLEWDVVWNETADYEEEARALACNHDVTAELRCFVANGAELRRRVACAE
jgi:hypothetical protein